MATLVDRIARLEREERETRAQLATGAASGLTEIRRLENYLAYITNTLATVRARSERRQAQLAAISRQAERTATGASSRGVWIRRPAPAPVKFFARPLPTAPVHRDGDVELVTVWAPHRDAPLLRDAKETR